MIRRRGYLFADPTICAVEEIPMRVQILISPLTKAAWFDASLEVAQAELAVHGHDAAKTVKVGGFEFLEVDAEEQELNSLARLSFVQGLFAVQGDALVPLDIEPGFEYPDGLVYGQKYQGKTNELVTQLALNVGLRSLSSQVSSGAKRLSLLDPMAGRGTSLMWALRYGFDARGVEIDEKATELFYAHVKKQCKLARLKHRTESGRIGKVRKQGKFVRFTFGDQKVTMMNGDSRLDSWTENKRFDLIVTDLPYGIQHKGDEKRNPLSVVEDCAPHWATSLKVGGVMVLVFNAYQTRRADLVEMFAGQGLEVQAFTAPHRMSESIIRDLIVFRHSSSVD